MRAAIRSATAHELSPLEDSGHWPALFTALLSFDDSFMGWTILGAPGALIAPSLRLHAQQKFVLVSTPILSGAFLRIVLSLLVDRIGTKSTGLLAQSSSWRSSRSSGCSHDAE